MNRKISFHDMECILVTIILMSSGIPLLTDTTNATPTTTDFFPSHPTEAKRFTLNHGQILDPSVRFHTDDMYFTPDSVIVRTISSSTNSGKGSTHSSFQDSPRQGEPYIIKTHVFRIWFEGCNRVIPEGRDMLAAKSNFFIGNDSANWKTGVPSFGRIIYPNVYDGIDLSYRSLPGGIKYEFLVHPGGNPQDIKLRYEGADIRTDGRNIFIDTSVGTLEDSGLYVYQEISNIKVGVDARIVVDGDTVSFSVAYDNRYPLVIDPFIFSSFLGGNDFDIGRSITVDKDKNVYIAAESGYTFPVTPGAYQTSMKGGSDITVSKFKPDGSELVFATYVGGSGYEGPCQIKLDSNRAVVVCGYTMSSDFPTTPGAYDRTRNSTSSADCFVFKLGPDGDKILFSTYFGGNGYEFYCYMDIDKSDNIYLCGETSSTDFPIYGKSFNLSSYGGIFVTKIKADGSGLVSSTVLGGNGADWPYSIVIDDINNTYVTGWTSSADFPTTPNAFDRRLDGGHDVFILKLNASWNAIDYSTLVGGSGDEIGGGIKLDSDGNICVAGSTNSSDFPVTSGAYDPTINGAWDFFAFKLNSSGDKMLFSTFIGGKSDDGILVGDNLFTKVGIDGSNDFIITGESYSMDFPLTPSADESTRRWSILLKLKSDGSALEYSSYLANGTPLSMELDSSGDLYATGYTTDSQFPTTPNAYDQTLNGASDIFFLKFRMPSRPSVPRNLSATQGDGYQILNWSAPASNGYKPVTGYLVYRGLQADNITKVATLGNVTSFNDSGLVNGRTYSYQLSALNAVGEGNRTAVFNYTTGTFPNPPTDLKSAGGNRFVNISWTAPADTKGFPIVNYSIYKGVGDGQNLTRCATIENITFFNDTAATNGLNHYYAVTAINARGESRKSPVKYALPGAVPSAPASLSALEGDGYVLIGWEPPNDDGGMPVQKYRIYEVKNGMPGLLEETTDLFWNVSEVKNGEPSIFAVSAINAIGEGELTPPITAIPGLVPDAPVLTLNGGNGIIELSWAVKYNGGLPVTRYDVFKSDKSASKVEFLFNTTETGYTDLTVMNGDTYYYAVSAANLKGEGARSPVKSATPVGDGRIPGLPVNLTGNPGNGYATISWSAPTDSGGLKDIEYKIYKGESEDSLSLLMDTSQTAFNDTRVINDVAYFYAVSAVNAIGEGSRTPTIQVMPKGDGRIPGIPLDFSVERVNNSIHLKWSEPTDYGGLEISTYNIYKGTDQTNIVKITSTPALTYLDNDWQYGIRYYYIIKSINRFGESAPSDVKDIALYDLASEVLNVTATTGYNFVLLKWSPPERKGGYDIKEYQIFKAQAKQDFTLLKSLKELEFNDTKVSNGFNYSYKIAAVNDLGSGPFSASVNATPGFTPGRPMNLKVEVQDGKVVMKWDPPGDKGGFKILEYRIYRGSSGKDLRLLASVNGTAFTDNNVAEGKKYYYSINAVNERGEGPASELKSITVPETLGIDAGMTVAISTAVILIVAVVVVVLLISRRRKSISNKTQGEDEKARGK